MDELVSIRKEFDFFISAMTHLFSKSTNIFYRRGVMMILMYLSKNDGVLSGELAKELNVGTGRIGNAIKYLEIKGYVRREKNTADKREVRIYLTSKGWELARRLDQKFNNLLSFLILKIGEDDLKTCLSLNHRIIDTLREYKEDRNV